MTVIRSLRYAMRVPTGISAQFHRETGPKAKGSAVRSGCRTRAPERVESLVSRYHTVKANLTRFGYALVVLATMALSLGAGKRW